MLFDQPPPEPFGKYLGFLLAWAGQRSARNFTAALEPLGLDQRQWVVLNLVDANPGVAQQELVESTSVDPSSMVAIVDGLEEGGLAERRPHASDRRKRAVHLTASGRKTLERGRAAIAKGQQELQAPLTADERETLRRLLRKLAGAGS
jgi:DNA-binding MarR family transcriptional regulator